MNKDDKKNDTTECRDISIEIMDTTDDRKPPAKVAPMGSPTVSSPDPKVKRKRRSPEKPWKKPKDMPKRPLSAYNLFFRDERERLLSAGSEGKQGDSETDGIGQGPAAVAGAKKQKKPSGIGFANLAKTIAAKWKELDGEVRSPYEATAAEEKKKYDEAVAEWRIKQTAKKKARPVKKDVLDERRAAPTSMREQMVPNIFSSERSLGSFSDSSNPYPSEWFHASHENDASGRVDSTRGSVPPVVETAPRTPYERSGYDSSTASPASWPHGRPRQDSYAYYHQQGLASDMYPVYSPDPSRNSHLNPSLFSQDVSMRTGPVSSSSGHPRYRDYFHHTPQSQHFQHSGRHGDMRSQRISSLPMSRHGDPMDQHRHPHTAEPPQPPQQQELRRQEVQHIRQNVTHLRPVRESASRYHHSQSGTQGSVPHPRSASMSHLHHPSTPIDRASLPHLYHPSVPVAAGDSRRRRLMVAHGESEMNDASYRSAPERVRPLSDPTESRASRRPFNPEQIEPVTNRRPFNPERIEPATNDESSIVETSLHSLTESLDEDAISFITSMKYS